MQAYLDSQIEPGERVLWAGTTDVTGRMRRLWPLVIVCAFMRFLCSRMFLVMDNPDKGLLVALSLLGWPVFGAITIWLQVGPSAPHALCRRSATGSDPEHRQAPPVAPYRFGASLPGRSRTAEAVTTNPEHTRLS
jgi:hypothetical protein